MDNPAWPGSSAGAGMSGTTETRQAVVQAICFAKAPANGKGSTWYILQTDIGRCTGEIAWEPKAGERLKLAGAFKIYAGCEQFAFTSAMPDVPDDPHALLLYVCSLAHGVGKALQDQIWATHGEQWQSMIAQGKTEGIDGCGPQRLAAIRTALAATERDKECAQITGRLMLLGATEKLAAKAWAKWELQTLAIVEADPYALTELDNVGFVQVDQSVAVALGIVGTDERRMRAGVLYALKLANQQGDTLVLWPDLCSEACRCLGATPADVCAAVIAAFEAGLLVGYHDIEGITAAHQSRAAQTILEYLA